MLLKKLPVAGLSLLTFFAACTNPTVEETTNPTATGLEIKAPIPNLDPSFTTFDVDASSSDATVLETETGTKITIPAGALVDADGNAIEGKAIIRYREFHDAVDVFLSGIPMDVEADGRKRTLQTAGMFEIRGEQEGKPVFMKEGSGADVRFASRQYGDDYDFWQLDQKDSKTWENMGKGEMEENPKRKKMKKEVDRMRRKAEADNLLSDKNFAFSFDAILDVMYTDYATREKKRNSSSSKSKAKSYDLTWINLLGHTYIPYKGQEYFPSSMLLWKRVSGKSFPSWLKKGQCYDYQIKPHKGDVYVFTAESLDRSKKYEGKIEAIMPLKSLFAFPAKHWTEKYDETMAKVREEERRMEMEAAVFRSFKIQEFGIYNYDRLLKDEDRIEVVADFKVDANNELYSTEMVYALPADNQTVIQLSKYSWEKVGLLPNNPMRFMTVLPGGAIGLYTIKEYKKINFKKLKKEEKPSYTFELVKVLEDVSSEEVLRETLGMI